MFLVEVEVVVHTRARNCRLLLKAIVREKDCNENPGRKKEREKVKGGGKERKKKL